MSAPTAPQGHRHVHLRRKGCRVHSGRFHVGGSTQKNNHPPGWLFFLVETTGTITPISPHFTHYLHLSKNRTAMRFFALFVSARATARIQIFRNFVYDSCAVLWAGTPLPIGFNTIPICSRRTRCTARGAPSSARPERRRRSPSSSSVPWKARPCCPLCLCPM